jgi:hypothetical protein
MICPCPFSHVDLNVVHLSQRVSVRPVLTLAVSIEPPVSLLQKLWHGSATVVLRGHIVLDVCPEPLDGLDARQVWWSVDQLMTIVLH